MILISNPAENVGRKLIPLLLEMGQEIQVFTPSLAEVAYLSGRAVCHVADLGKPETFSGALKDVDKIFLNTSNTRQDWNLLEEAKRSNVRLVVKLSRFEAGLRSPSRNGTVHHDREEILKQSGLSWAILRPTLLSNMALIWARSVARDRVIYCPGGGGKVAPIDPRDVALVAARLLTQDWHEGETYTLTGPELLSMDQMAGVLSKYLDKPVQFVAVTEPEFIRESTRNGISDEGTKKWLEIFKAVRQGKCSYLTDTVERITGRRPHSFGAWCHEHIAAFQPRAMVEDGAYI